MNKDKNWLNEQLAYYKDAVSKPAVNDLSRGLNAAYDTIQLLVDQLEEPMKIPELLKFVDEIIKDSSYIEISEIELVNKIKSRYSFLEWFGKKFPDASNREMERYLLIAILFDYTIEKEPDKLYEVKLSTENAMGNTMNLVQGGSKNRVWFDSLDDRIVKFKFTEKEIKAIDERYWAFAEEVK